MTTPSKADVLRVAGEPVAWRAWDDDLSRWDFTLYPDERCNEYRDWQPVYTESQLLAMYAAGAESAKADGWRQCAVGQRPSQFCGQIEAEKAKAYAKGAEDMRERADDAWADAIQSDCEHGVKWLSEKAAKDLHAAYPALARLGETIRALPITPTNTEGEQGNG